MTDSTFEQPLPPKRLADVALPSDAPGRRQPHTYPEMAAAGLWTTPTDLAHYALGVRAALAGKSKVISASTARAMLDKGHRRAGPGAATRRQQRAQILLARRRQRRLRLLPDRL